MSLWLLIAPLFAFHPVTHHSTLPVAYTAAPPVVVSQQASIGSETVQSTPTPPTPTPTHIVASKPVAAPPISQPAATSGSHTDWMRAAGIAPSDYPYVEYIVAHESGWNPSAVNKSSGACGLAQQLPCGKWAHQWNDPVGGLIDASGYAVARYGGWHQAYLHWLSSGNW
jgi:hypothetical protein